MSFTDNVELTDKAELTAKAAELLQLHTAPDILTLINVWDVISARVIAGLDRTHALATASHSIAAAHGYPDGEQIPVDEMIAAVGKIAAATELPVTADLEAGYGNSGETIRKGIGVGIVGANLEDQMKPLTEAVDAVAAAVAAADAEGVSFVLNARTDAFLRAGDRPLADVTGEAIDRGRAFLDAGAACFFVPGLLDEETVRSLVDGLGPQKISLIAVPGSLTVAQMASLGVARVSVGPWSQRIALTALADAAADILAGGSVPRETRQLN
ncbi:MAG: isocitrate lyase/phosphoenolpyruvate mutase family protein [Propionibacteriaceae bacterium]|nr:isocitrate lyase/phosphoenolpyruvate mutase family protein [Propionibacteriaceae bacterium]